MTSTDKNKLDASTSLYTASTLVQRDANSMIQLKDLQLVSADNAYYTSIKMDPTTFGGPNHNVGIPVPSTDDTIALLAQSQSLTNKTMSSNTNNVYAKQLFTNASAASVDVTAGGPPVVGNALVATSSSAATWKNVPVEVPVFTGLASVGSGAAVDIAYYVWPNPKSTAYTTFVATAWIVPSTVVGKDLTINIYDPINATSLGALAAVGGGAAGIVTSTFTAPASSTYIIIRVSRLGAAGDNPLIYSLVFNFA